MAIKDRAGGGHGVSVFVSPGKIVGISVACRGTATVTHGVSLVVEGPTDYAGVLLNEPAFSASIPNQFYGIAEYAPVVIELANLDGVFTHLLEDDEREAFVRVRLYDESSATAATIATGIIDRFAVGDSVKLQVVQHNLAKLADPFPRRLVTQQEFPNATDTGAPIPVFFGTGHDSPCPYINSDDVNQWFDYMVGDGKLDVLEIKKDGVPSFIQPLSFVTIQGSGIWPAQVVRTQFYVQADDFHDPGTYNGFFLRGTVGAIRDRIWRIVAHDEQFITTQVDPINMHWGVHYKGVTGGIGATSYITWRAVLRGASDLSRPVVTAAGSSQQFVTSASWVINTTNVAGQVTMVVVAQASGFSLTGSTGSWFEHAFEPFSGLPRLRVFTKLASSSGADTLTLTYGGPATGRSVPFKISSAYSHNSFVFSKSEFIISQQVNCPREVTFTGEQLLTNGTVILAQVLFFGPRAPIGPNTVDSEISEFYAFSGISGIDTDMVVAAQGYAAPVRSIVTIDGTLTAAEIATIELTTPAAQVQEYSVIAGEQPYPLYTVARFGRRQEEDGALKQIAATATRAQPRPRNILDGSEDIADDSSWAWPTNRRTTDVVTVPLDGRPPGSAGVAYTGPTGLLGAETFVVNVRAAGAHLGDDWIFGQKNTTGFDPLQQTYTLSFWWYDNGATRAVDLTFQWSSATDTDTATVAIVGPTATPGKWQFFTYTFTPNPVAFATTEVVTELAVSWADSVSGFQCGFFQLEEGDSFTTYERTRRRRKDLPHGGIAWTAVDAMRDIIKSARYGLGDPVNDPSFDAGRQALLPPVGSTTTLRGWQIAVNGVMPGPHGNEPTTQEVLDELARTCGAVLSHEGEAWTIDVDKVDATIVGVFGTEETPYQNLLDTQIAERPSITESTRQLRVLYNARLGRFAQQVEPFYASGIDRTVGDHGVLTEAQFNLVSDDEAADRVSARLGAYAPFLERPITATADATGVLLRPGKLIALYAPQLQPQNLAKHSEREISADGWTQSFSGGTAAPTIIRRCGLGPFGTDYSATRVIFPAITGAGGFSYTHIGGSNVTSYPEIMLRAYGSMWFRSPAGATLPSGTFGLLLGNGPTSQNQPITIGKTWQQQRVEWALAPGDLAAGNIYLSFTRGGTSLPACEVEITRAQITLDWPRPYVKTTNTTIDPTYTYKLTSVDMERDKAQFTAIPYDANTLFAPYTPGQVFTPRIPDDLTVSFVDQVPDEATDLRVPPQSGSGIDAGTLYWAEVRFVMPERNAIGVIVQYQRAGDMSWTNLVTITSPLLPGQAPTPGVPTLVAGAPGTPVTTVIRGLATPATYFVRVISFDAKGRYRGTGAIQSFELPVDE